MKFNKLSQKKKSSIRSQTSMTELINKQDVEMILSTTMDLKNACLKETLKTNIEQEYALF